MGESPPRRNPMTKVKKKTSKANPKAAKNPSPNRAAAARASAGFSADERDAMRARVEEMRAEARPGGRGNAAEGENAALAALAAMPPNDRALGERLHALVKAHAPDLAAKTWYGMPAYAQGGQVVCFFQSAHKFKARYATLGFSHHAKLDEGQMWPVSFALLDLGAAEEARVIALLKKALR